MNEEFERRWERQVEFLLNQQAKFDAGLEELKASQAEIQAAQRQTEQSLDRAAKNISHLAGFIHEGFGLVMNLFKETDAKRKETDEQLQKLLGRINRHLSEDHGLEN